MTTASLQLSNGYFVRCWEQLATVFVRQQIKRKCHRQIVIGSSFPLPRVRPRGFFDAKQANNNGLAAVLWTKTFSLLLCGPWTVFSNSYIKQ